MARIFVVAAPSGGGKTSLVNGVLEQVQGLKLSISYTTRARRPNEEDGKQYHFVSQDEFQQMVKDKCFLEHAEVFGNYYGTARRTVEDALQQGLDLILEIDWQGAKQIKDNFPEAVLIFVLPPSLTALEERLRARASDSDETIARRLQQAEEDISQYRLFDYLVVNDNFAHARQQLVNIVEALRLSRATQEVKLAKLLKELSG